MKKYFFILAATAFSLITSVNTSFAQTSAMNNDAKTTADNKLSGNEKKDGWVLLFDGKTLNGWRTYQHKPSTSWVAENGMLVSKADHSATAKHADLITDKEYGNFELQIDWKIPQKANSGIMYRVTEDQSQTFESGPEYQLIDDKGYANEIEPEQASGANYAMNAPSEVAANPVGEWNHTVIIVNNNHVEHWLNGKKVVEYELGSDDWKNRKEKSKWKDAAGYGAAKKGHIALQESHGVEGDILFKNIKIKELK